MLLDEIKAIVAENAGEINEKKGAYKFIKVVAERKAFLSKQKLEYIATFRIDDNAKTIVFSEMLKEAGSGLSSSSGDDMSPGFGFKTETYKTGMGAREGSIKEQSNLFSKKYEYVFDFNDIRPRFESAAESSGYTFAYQILPVK